MCNSLGHQAATCLRRVVVLLLSQSGLKEDCRAIGVWDPTCMADEACSCAAFSCLIRLAISEAALCNFVSAAISDPCKRVYTACSSSLPQEGQRQGYSSGPAKPSLQSASEPDTKASASCVALMASAASCSACSLPSGCATHEKGIITCIRDSLLFAACLSSSRLAA